MAPRLGVLPDRAVGPGKARVFRAEDGSHAEGGLGLFDGVVVVLPELFSHEAEEAVIRRVGEVVGAHPGGIAFSPGSPGDDERNVSLPAGGDEKGFFLDGIDRIDDDVEPVREQSFGGVFGEKGETFVNDEFRVDESHPFGERGDFEAPHRSVQRRELPVHIGDADLVEVNEGDLPDTAAGERFRSPGADPAHADDGDMRGAECWQGRRSVKTGDSREAVEIVGWKIFVQ